MVAISNVMKARFTFLTLVLLTNACTADKNDSATDGSDGSDGSETGATTGTESTTGEPTSTTGETGSPTTGEITSTTSDGFTSDGFTSGGFTSGETWGTTGEAVPEVPECPAFCAKSLECGLEQDDCVEDCSKEYAAKTPVCIDATSAYLNCMAGLSCLDFDPYADPGPCPIEGAQRDEVCGTGNDFCGVGYGGTGDDCGLEIDCRGEPRREMVCDTEICTCFVGDEQTGSCAAEAVCEDLDALKEKGAACCGF